jgi:hypothetical protein
LVRVAIDRHRISSGLGAEESARLERMDEVQLGRGTQNVQIRKEGKDRCVLTQDSKVMGRCGMVGVGNQKVLVLVNSTGIWLSQRVTNSGCLSHLINIRTKY